MSPATSPSRADAPGVRALDELAALLVSAPLRAAPTETSGQLESVLRLRHAHVTREGRVEPGALPDGVETDAFDADAVHVAAREGEELVGTVGPSPG